MKTDQTAFWFEQLKHSDHEALKNLYHETWEDLYRYCLRKTGDVDDSVDLTQDLFIELWEKRESLPTIHGTPKAYMRGIMAYKLAGYFKRKGFRRMHEEQFKNFLQTYSITDLHEEVEEKIQLEHLMAFIGDVVAHMPKKMRDVFLLSKSGEYSVTEIARLLNLSPQTVRNQTHHAMLRIRNRAKEEFPEMGVTLAFFLYFTIN